MIFYFSGTGNTLWAAKQLAEATNEQLIFIPDHLDNAHAYQLKTDERVGFCFPVHGWRPPKIVRQFIGNFTLKADGHYIYALCTAGNTIGETIDILTQDLEKRGLTLSAAFSIVMPETYVGVPFMDVDNAKDERRKLEAAERQLDTAMRAIVNRQENKQPLHIGRWPMINSRLIGGVFVKYLVTDKPFHVVQDRCLKCGTCAKVCPVNDIAAEPSHTPTWLHNGMCLTCFTCYHHCPTHAIEFGRQTRRKGQYFFNHRRHKENDMA